MFLRIFKTAGGKGAPNEYVRSVEVRPDINSFRFSLTAVAVASLLVFKLVVIRTAPLTLILATWLFEAGVFLWLLLLSTALSRWGAGERIKLSVVSFHAFFWPYLALCFAYGFFFREASERKFSLLDVDMDEIKYFFVKVLPRTGWLAFGGLLLCIAIGAVVLRRRPVRLRWRDLACYLVGLTVVQLLYLPLLSSFPSPLVDMVRDLADVLSHTHIRPHDHGSPLPIATLDRSGRDPVAFTSSIRKVVVYVMEQITLRTLEEEMVSLPESEYLKSSRQRWLLYSNYFSSDQDSRTGLLAMLSARFIPFEAYRDAEVKRYKALAEQRSLVDIMRENGYWTAAAVSQREEEYLVFDLPWDEKITVSEKEFNPHGKYLCFYPFEFEHSCEDKILLPRVTEALKSHDKAFIFQEGIWGHTSHYYDATKKSSVRYYSEYLGELSRRLEEAGLLDQTLIVLTSDHGIRDKGYETSLFTYRIPLIFVHPRYTDYHIAEELHSQMDFQDLLLAELTEDRRRIPTNDIVMFNGPTNSGFFGVIDSSLDLLVIKDRPRLSYVITAANFADESKPPAAPKKPLDAPAFLSLYRRYRSGFLEGGPRTKP